MEKKIYIKSFSRISVCHPDPDYRTMLSMMEARRMSVMMKRAVAVTKDAVDKSGIGMPDAIISATGLGCIENTDIFLKALKGLSDAPMRPTNFMQSTHNTVGSLVAIRMGCHGYNATYSHTASSFESALMDACMQISLGRIGNALVCAFEELTPDFCRILQKAGNDNTTVDGKMTFTAVAMVLSDNPDNAICELSQVNVLRRPSPQTPLPQADAVLTRPEYVSRYGDNLSVSALGACDAVEMVRAGRGSVLLTSLYKDVSLSTILFKPC